MSFDRLPNDKPSCLEMFYEVYATPIFLFHANKLRGKEKKTVNSSSTKYKSMYTR
jgi:hypothetical protein